MAALPKRESCSENPAVRGQNTMLIKTSPFPHSTGSISRSCDKPQSQGYHRESRKERIAHRPAHSRAVSMKSKKSPIPRVAQYWALALFLGPRICRPWTPSTATNQKNHITKTMWKRKHKRTHSLHIGMSPRAKRPGVSSIFRLAPSSKPSSMHAQRGPVTFFAHL